MATEYATLTFIAETDSLVAAEKRLNSVARTGARTQKSVDKIRTSSVAAGRSVYGFGRNAGQASIQLQQLFGQVQAGTNPMVALSQQATDLGFVLGVPLIGAVTGIAASIAGPLVSALFSGSDAIDEFNEGIDDMIENLDEYTEAERRAAAVAVSRDLREQRKEYEQLESRLEGLRSRLDEATSNTRSLFDNMRPEEIEELREEVILAAGALDKQGGAVEDLERQLGILTGELDANTEAQNENASAAERFVERVQEQADTIGLTRTETLLYKAAQLELNAAQMEQVRIAAERLDQYDQEQRALEENMNAQNAAWEEMKRRRDEHLAAEKEAERERQAALQELRSAGLIGQEENELQSLERRRQQLEKFRQQELINEQQYQEASRNLERETVDAKVGIVGDSLNQLGKINEDAFKAAKAFNIAQAIMNTYTGATKALATYPPPFNFIAAAGVVAAGMAQVSTIRSQTYSGRALGGQVRAGESFVVGERGPEVLTMGSSNGRIIPNESLRQQGNGQMSGGRTTNVTFNINTVDARGFDQLLQSRRGQIISMINSASNDRGRRAVV